MKKITSVKRKKEIFRLSKQDFFNGDWLNNIENGYELIEIEYKSKPQILIVNLAEIIKEETENGK